MGKKSDENKEKAILEAAVKIINEKGFHAATTKEIAREAGVAEGTIYNYFPSKKDILHQILIKIVDQVILPSVVEPFDSVLLQSKEKNPEEALRYILMDRILLLEQNLNLLRVGLTEFQHHPDLRDISHEKLFFPMRRKVEQYLKDGIAAGIFREFDVSVMASSFLGMLLSLIFGRRIVMNDSESGFDKDISILVDILFRGIGKEHIE